MVVQTRRLLQGLGERHDRVTQHALTTLQTMHEVVKRLMPDCAVDHQVVAQGKIVVYAGPQTRELVRQSGERSSLVALSPGRLGGGYIFGTLIRGVVDESKMPLQGAGGVPCHLWGARHPHVAGLRSGRLCHRNPEGPGPRGVKQLGIQPKGQPVARCRGRPADGQERTGQDRRDHWYPEDGQIWVQQAQGTSVADAGDGRSSLYHSPSI